MAKHIIAKLFLPFFLFFLIQSLFCQENYPALKITRFSPEVQYLESGSYSDKPLIVKITDKNSTPVVNEKVTFSFIKFPENSSEFRIENPVVLTDSEGKASAKVKTGSQPGEYLILASINNTVASSVSFKIINREEKWFIFLLFGLSGGLALFLYGMHIMSEGLRKTAGDRMRTILHKITNNRLVAVGLGAFVTMVIQSSSATTVMLVGFVQARLMTFAQSIGIILGADIGTTITAQLIAFKFTDYALPVLAIGVFLFLVFKKDIFKHSGEAILGFGMLFLGMDLMSEAMVPLRTYDPFINLLISMENPLLGLLVGTIFTALIQSSSAFTGILIVLAGQNLLTLEAAIPLLFGANIGTCITAILAALNSSREAKRVALAHTLFKVVGVILFIWWIPTFVELVKWVSPITNELESVPRQIANAHTIFNVGLTLIVLPLTHQMANLVQRLLPEKEQRTHLTYSTKFLDYNVLHTPALAISLAKKEIIRLGFTSREMTKNIIKPFIERESSILNRIERDEEKADFLSEQLYDYLTQISKKNISQAQVDEVFRMMYCVTEFEQIADIVAKILKPRAEQWLNKNYSFSSQGQTELLEFHQKTLHQLERAQHVFIEADLNKAREMKQKHKKYRTMGMGFMRTHFERLKSDVAESKATSEFHQDLIEQFRRITGHATNIARMLLDWTEDMNRNDEKIN